MDKVFEQKYCHCYSKKHKGTQVQGGKHVYFAQARQLTNASYLQALKKLYYTDPAYASCKLMLGQQFHYRDHFPLYSGQMLVQSTNKRTSFIVVFLKKDGKIS